MKIYLVYLSTNDMAEIVRPAYCVYADSVADAEKLALSKYASWLSLEGITVDETLLISEVSTETKQSVFTISSGHTE